MKRLHVEESQFFVDELIDFLFSVSQKHSKIIGAEYRREDDDIIEFRIVGKRK